MTDKVKLIKDCFDAFGRGDVGLYSSRGSATTSNGVAIRAAEIPYAGIFEGPQGVGQFFARIGRRVDDQILGTQARASSADDGVLATGAWSAEVKSTGRSFATEWAMVFGFRDGKISSFRVSRIQPLRRRRSAAKGSRPRP